MSQNVVQGDLGVFSIFDVTQSLVMGRKSGAVLLEREGRRGYLYFRDGQIVAALDDELGRGERAAMSLFAWRNGRFSIDFTKEAPEQNIDTPTDYLMLEVARNMDEAQRDSGTPGSTVAPTGVSEARIERDVKSRVESALANKLGQAFQKMATTAEPGRATFSAAVFDGLLVRVAKGEGTALFLKAGHPPRLRTARGFTEIPESIISALEINSFLRSALTAANWQELAQRSEVTTHYRSDRSGPFRLHVTMEWGGHLLTFAPAAKAAPQLTELLPADLAGTLTGLDDGLLVVAGPIGAGKAQLVASLVQAHVDQRDRLAVVFTATPQHTIEGRKGLCMHRELPPAGAAFHGAMRGVLEQGADLIAVLGSFDRESFHLALAAAGAHRLVVYGLESATPSQSIAKLLRFARTEDGDPLLDTLASRLRFLIDVRPGPGLRPELASALAVDRTVAEELRAGAGEALRRRVLGSLPEVKGHEPQGTSPLDPQNLVGRR